MWLEGRVAFRPIFRLDAPKNVSEMRKSTLEIRLRVTLWNWWRSYRRRWSTSLSAWHIPFRQREILTSVTGLVHGTDDGQEGLARQRSFHMPDEFPKLVMMVMIESNAGNSHSLLLAWAEWLTLAKRNIWYLTCVPSDRLRQKSKPDADFL